MIHNNIAFENFDFIVYLIYDSVNSIFYAIYYDSVILC